MGLLTKAYGLYPDQILGPSWLISETYTISANVPLGASKEEFKQMLQDLLVRRFKLATHREEKDFTVYTLSVAPSGIRNLKLSSTKDVGGVAPDAEPQAVKPPPVVLDKDGCPVMPPGIHGAAGGMEANNCSAFRKYSMSDLAKFLEMAIAMETGSYYGPQASQAHVIDNTGLHEEFDFTLRFGFRPRIAPPGARISEDGGVPNGPDVSTALEKQLGLKLKEGKAKLLVLVVDEVIKVPTEN